MKEVKCVPKSKRVTFRVDLIQGPSRNSSTFEVGSTSESGLTGEAGVTSGQRRNSDSDESEEEPEEEA